MSYTEKRKNLFFTCIIFLFKKMLSQTGLLPWCVGLSSCSAQMSEHRAQSSQAQYLQRPGPSTKAWSPSCPAACGIPVLWPGIEPTFPTLEGGLSTTEPPGKSLYSFLNWGRVDLGEGNGNLNLHSYLENLQARFSTDRRASFWRSTVHRAAKSQIWLMWLHTHTNSWFTILC